MVKNDRKCEHFADFLNLLSTSKKIRERFYNEGEYFDKVKHCQLLFISEVWRDYILYFLYYKKSAKMQVIMDFILFIHPA